MDYGNVYYGKVHYGSVYYGRMSTFAAYIKAGYIREEVDYASIILVQQLSYYRHSSLYM